MAEIVCKINDFMKDLNSLKIEHLEKWFTDESTIWIPPSKQISGKNRILALFRAIFRRYDSIEWQVFEIFPLGNQKFFYQTTSYGRMTDKGVYENNICTLVQFSEEGKIIYLSDYFKDTKAFN
ncbi:hypothetical protein AU378_18370 [Chryseobacterium kwangjuense]|uniref:SnoaL-like domain-containing protein n=2 Tax=Chryseobacterium kwangjuense TaxID=267125 RepID=A0A135W6M7_9FLAO|nr:hypothetical protein AU378_18370 [Chryseobacterium kwangjuense]